MERRSFLLTLGLLGALAWLGSCSASQPKVLVTFTQLNYYQDSRDFTWRESLAVFFNLENKDGLGEIDKIHILSDKDQLYWELTPDSWQVVPKDSQNWIGSSLLLMPSGDFIPRGNYRAQVTTKAGSRTEVTFNVNSPSLRDYKEPLSEVFLYKDQLLLSPPRDSFVIWSYNKERKILHNFKATGGQANLKTLYGDTGIAAQVGSFFVYYYEETKGVGFLLGPYAYNLTP